MGILSGKKALVLGVASKKSIAWGIAEAMKREGASVALGYQNDRLENRAKDFAEKLASPFIVKCDVDRDNEIENAFLTVAEHWETFDILVHSIAFAPTELLKGDYLENLDREGFRIAHETSSYSFAAVGKAARPLLSRNSSLLTLSYIGAGRAMPSYNIMGLAKASLEANVRYMANSLGPNGTRVNAISAGPIKTLAASGVKDLRKFLTYVENHSPLRKNVTIEEVGNAACFLCSDMASAITGELTYVDCGYNILGMTETSNEQ